MWFVAQKSKKKMKIKTWEEKREERKRKKEGQKKNPFALRVYEQSCEIQPTCGDGLKDLPFHCLKITDHNLEEAMLLMAQAE